MKLLSNLYSIVFSIVAGICAFFGVYLLGKSSAKKEMENQNDKEALDAIRKAVRIREDTRSLSRQQLIDKLRPWIRKDK